MADNYLERHREDYEQRKARWLCKKKGIAHVPVRQLERPDDESL